MLQSYLGLNLDLAVCEMECFTLYDYAGAGVPVHNQIIGPRYNCLLCLLYHEVHHNTLYPGY